MNFRVLSLYLIVIFIIFGVISTPKVFAVTADSILVTINPESPAPGENTNITLSSYASNLNSAKISWSVGGKTLLTGVGEKSFSLNAPSASAETAVTVTITLPDGSIKKVVTIKPAIMVLLWQANDSYVPPFYKGKALPTPDSQVKVVALPEIKTGSKIIDPKNMVYAWKQDYTNDQEASGYGKNYFIYTNDYLDKYNNISVNASTTDQKYSLDKGMDIKTYKPKILFYKNDANLGTLWEQALANGHKIQNDETIEAAPYFISPKDIRIPILTWDWSINDSLIDMSVIQKNLLPLKVQPGVSGTSKIRLEINNKYKIFATASKEINVEF
ncbi:MAG: hypothetical protein WCP17_02005 [bacterium]